MRQILASKVNKTMAITPDMKKLAEDIISFRGERKDYVKDIKKTTADLRAKHVGEIREMAGDVKKMLATYDREMKELAKDLKDFLAKSETKRLADFKPMIAAIQARIKDIRKDTANLRARFVKEHKAMAADLKKFLATSEADRKEEFAALWKDIVARVRDIRKDTKNLMARLRREHEELAGEVKELLAEVDRDMKGARVAWAKVYGGLPPKAEAVPPVVKPPVAKPKPKRKRRKKK